MNLRGGVLLTGASIAPVLFVYGLVALVDCLWLFSGISIALGLLLGVGGPAFLYGYRKHLPQRELCPSKVEAADREGLGILIIYFLPLLRLTIPELEYVALIPAIAIFLALALTGHSYHFNPLLKALGWNFYKVDTPEGVSYVLITRQRLRRAGDTITVRRVTPYTMVEFER